MSVGAQRVAINRKLCHRYRRRKKTEGDGAIVEDTVKGKAEVEASFKEVVARAVSKLPKETTVEKPTMDDKNRTFRTRLVAIWMLSNAALAIAIESLNGLASGNQAKDNTALEAKQHTYFSILLWSTFGLSFVRFTGCLYYFFRRNLFRWCRRS